MVRLVVIALVGLSGAIAVAQVAPPVPPAPPQPQPPGIWQPPPPPTPSSTPPAAIFPYWLPGLLAAIWVAHLATIQRQEEEEEAMSPTEPGYEYKFLRSTGGAFKKPEKMREALAAEAPAGWELVEKFDDKRLRLRRPLSARTGDHALDWDPYRSSFGISEAKQIQIVLIVIGVVVALLLIVIVAVAR